MMSMMIAAAAGWSFGDVENFDFDTILIGVVMMPCGTHHPKAARTIF